MRREKERLIPVRSPSELRAGMLVVNRYCERGHSEHRHMLISNDVDEFGPIWAVAPMVNCGNEGRPVDGFDPRRSINRGALFIVDTGLEDDTATETVAPTRKPARVSR